MLYKNVTTDEYILHLYFWVILQLSPTIIHIAYYRPLSFYTSIITPLINHTGYIFLVSFQNEA